MELIPGLPRDVALECLIRVPHDGIPTVGTVSKQWKAEVESPEFWHRRKASGKTQPLVVLAQARVDPNRKSGGLKSLVLSSYFLSVLEPETGRWSELPPIPCLSDGLPVLSRVVVVESGLVVMGGYDPKTWAVSNSVFVFNFRSYSWRRGVDMPGGPRSLFGCASDSRSLVLVAGGHDGDKNALKSAHVYDVADDAWIKLPGMARARDECQAVFHRGRFHVVGGYPTESQGSFGSSAESLDVAARRWGPVEDGFLPVDKCRASCIVSSGRDVYWCQDGELVARRTATWESVGRLPAEVYGAAYVATWQEKKMVIGCSKLGGPHSAYVVDLEAGDRWRKLEAAEGHSGHVQWGCCLEI